MELKRMTLTTIHTERYARCIEASKRVRWDIDRDVIRARRFDFSKPFLPEGLARTGRLEFLSPAERLRLSQVQGRTYANMFGLVERFIGIQMLSCSRDHWFGDQVALEALVRFSDEELKHQELFRRIERLAADGMAEGYEFLPTPNAVASQVLECSTWAVLALTCHIELFTQVHYRESIEPAGDLSDLYKDVFLFHWKEESQHAVLDELEWERENARLTPGQRDAAVDDLIALVGAIDGILQQQAAADASYFLRTSPDTFTPAQAERVQAGLLDAYRWQYIVCGVKAPRFRQSLIGMTTPDQWQRIQGALAPLMN
ncbi:hypothetical protein [Hydrogenophaga sp. IBVHS1]|uniref:hypothetical protein n=2 Tax=unclassified Hydrogenophaga TaxID=2610897 RepID=UPI002119BEF2|nr:hypothetical protein [Hydrogenophaga sp. IBVHS1]